MTGQRIIILVFICLLNTPFVFASDVVSEDSKVIEVLDFKNMEILDAFKYLSLKSGLNFAANQNVKGRISIYLKNVDVIQALDIIVETQNFAYIIDKNVVKIMTAKDYEDKYGEPFGKSIETKILSLTHVDSSNVLNVLNQLKSEDGKLIADQVSNTIIIQDELKSIQAMEAIVAGMDVPLETRVFKLNHTQVPDVLEKIKSVLTAGVGVVYDDALSNSLIVTDNTVKLDKISAMINVFDRRQSEVFIEAKIIQVVLSDEYKMGVNWQAMVDSYHGLQVDGNFDVLNSNDKFGRLGIGTLDGDNYQFLVESLETIGETNILSNPRITALNKQEAKILVGSTEPYVTSTVTTPSSGPSTTAESVNFIEVGVKLFATPIIHEDGYITMKIKPEVSSVTRNVVTANNNTIPVVETSEAETTVMIKDQSTIIIGGLIKEETISTQKQVPLFGRIPVINHLFRNIEEVTRKTEIVIFLTPRIITGDQSDQISAKSHLNGIDF